jgi:hypothetical protein
MENIGGNLVNWIAFTGDGRGFIFRAPENWSKSQACSHAEKVWDTLFVTVHQL